MREGDEEQGGEGVVLWQAFRDDIHGLHDEGYRGDGNLQTTKSRRARHVPIADVGMVSCGSALPSKQLSEQTDEGSVLWAADSIVPSGCMGRVRSVEE